MIHPICALTCNVRDPHNDPVAGAVLIATLSGPDVDAGIVAKRVQRAYADVNGDIAIALWPNVRGLANTYYNVDIQHITLVPVRYSSVVIPDRAHFALEEWLGASPPVLPSQLGILMLNGSPLVVNGSYIALR